MSLCVDKYLGALACVCVSNECLWIHVCESVSVFITLNEHVFVFVWISACVFFMCKYLSVRVCARFCLYTIHNSCAYMSYYLFFFFFFFFSTRPSLQNIFFLPLFIDLLSPLLQNFHSPPSIFNPPPTQLQKKRKTKQEERKSSSFTYFFGMRSCRHSLWFR